MPATTGRARGERVEGGGGESGEQRGEGGQDAPELRGWG